MVSHSGRLGSAACLLLLLLILGCGNNQQKAIEDSVIGNRQEVYPVSGTVLVDGKPVENLTIQIYRPDGVAMPTTAQTDSNGNFKLATYNPGDGAPKGEYILTVEWLRYRKATGTWVGPDKLKGRYSDPSRSTFKFEVVDKPVSGLKYELTAGP